MVHCILFYKCAFWSGNIWDYEKNLILSLLLSQLFPRLSAEPWNSPQINIFFSCFTEIWASYMRTDGCNKNSKRHQNRGINSKMLLQKRNRGNAIKCKATWDVKVNLLIVFNMYTFIHSPVLPNDKNNKKVALSFILHHPCCYAL